MPADDGPTNQRTADNRSHEQRKQQPTESIYLKSENEKKETTKLVRSKKRRSENVWKKNLPDETESNNQTQDWKEEKQLRLQTIKRNRKEINESLGTSKNEKTATTELVRSTKRRSENVWGNKLTG